MSILFSIIISRHSKKNLNKNFYNSYYIFVIFFSKNVKRIITVEKNYFNTPWPKYFSHSEDNIYKKPKKIMIKKKTIYHKWFMFLWSCTMFTAYGKV